MTLATNILLYIQTMTRDDNKNYWKNKLHLMYSICACNLQSICIPHAVINKTFISNFESVQDWVGVACHHCGIVPVRIKCNMVSSYQNHIRISTRRKLLTDFIRRISNHAFSYFMIKQHECLHLFGSCRIQQILNDWNLTSLRASSLGYSHPQESLFTGYNLTYTQGFTVFSDFIAFNPLFFSKMTACDLQRKVRG